VSALEEKGSHAAHLRLLLDEDLEVLVDDGHSQQDSGARPDGSHEVGEHGEGADTETAESGGGGDVTVQLVDHGSLPVSTHDHLLFPELLGHVLGGAAGHVDPRLGEERAGAEHEEDVEDGVYGIGQHRAQRFRRRQVVTQPSDGISSAASSVVPDSEEGHEEVATELNGHHLRDHVEIGHQRRLQDDRDVGSVEQLDGLVTLLASVAGRLDG